MTTPLNNKKGTTLVELMVCLVLLALFGVAAVTLVKPSAEAYISIQQLTRAQNLADALTDSIRGELSTADGTIAIVNATADGNGDANSVLIASRLTQGTGLLFSVENSYVEVLDAGYVPLLQPKTKENDNTPTKVLYNPADTSFAPLDKYLHMRFYKEKEDEPKSDPDKRYDIYAYTTAYPNGDYMGLVISNLKFYARGWKHQKVTTSENKQVDKICLTSLTMQLTISDPKTGKDIYTQTAIIPLPGTPEFN